MLKLTGQKCTDGQTHVFTKKAMGEMVVEHLKGNLCVVIIRPTIITSTFKEPFPGWVEGLR